MRKFKFNDLNKYSPCKLFETNIKKYLEYYGGDIEQVCKDYNKLLKYLAGVVIAPIIIGILLIRPFLFASIPLAIFTYFYPVLYSWAKREEYKKIVNNEAPFIALVAYVNSLVEKSLLTTLKELTNIKELKTPKIEVEYLDKMTSFMNLSLSKALERRAIVHSNDLLGKLYNNYLIALSLGITVKDRLRDVLRDILSNMKDSYKAYMERAVDIAEMEFAVLLLLPIVLVGFAFTFKISVIQLFFPLLFVPGLIFLVATLQPSFDYNIKYGKFIYLLSAIPVILIIPHVSITYKVIGILSVVTITSYFVYSQVKLANELENSISIILKELSEYMKLGYTPSNALTKIKTNKKIDQIIAKLIKNPEGISTPSKLFNITMKLVFLMSKTGVSSSVMEELANTLNDVIYTKANLVKQLRLFDLMVVLTPIILWMAFNMLSKVINNVMPETAIIAIYSLASALVFSKLSRFTLLYFPIMLIVISVVTILSFIPLVFL